MNGGHTSLAAGLLLLLLSACAPTLPPWDPDGGFPGGSPGVDNPFVHQEGARLVDGAGAPLTLTGVNLGGWLAWEGWIWGGGWQSEKDMLDRLRQLVGAEEAARFVQRVHDGYIGEEDIAEIARLGFNSVRVPFNHTLLEEDSAPFVYKPSGWEVLDRLLGWGETHGVYVVLDLHAAPGGQSPFYMADPDSTSLWASNLNKDRTVALWKAIAERYRSHPALAGYDLLNEPRPPRGQELFDLYRRIAAEIRQVDPHHLIIVEGGEGGTDFSLFTRPVTSNQAYSFHMYTWFGDPRREELARYAAISREHAIPMWNGEFGENSREMISSTAAMYTEPGSGLSGFSFWTWKKVPNNTPHLVGVTASMPAWKKLVSWLASGWNPRPTVDEARRGMDEFLEAARLSSCELDPGMAAALQASP